MEISIIPRFSVTRLMVLAVYSGRIGPWEAISSASLDHLGDFS
jgi:hypothetical protein